MEIVNLAPEINCYAPLRPYAALPIRCKVYKTVFGILDTRAANSNSIFLPNSNLKLKILWNLNLTRTRKYLKQVRVNFYLYNIITTEFRKDKIFLLEIKDLTQKVGLSQAFSEIV